jgi:hypothetical protein
MHRGWIDELISLPAIVHSSRRYTVVTQTDPLCSGAMAPDPPPSKRRRSDDSQASAAAADGYYPVVIFSQGGGGGSDGSAASTNGSIVRLEHFYV